MQNLFRTTVLYCMTKHRRHPPTAISQPNKIDNVPEPLRHRLENIAVLRDNEPAVNVRVQ